MPEEATVLLKEKYNLHNAPEVTAAVQRHTARTGENVSQAPLERVQTYLDRFREVTDREDPDARERGIDAGKRLLYRKYVVKPDEIPEGFWETQRRIIRERGQEADLAYANWEKLKRENAEAIIVDQKASLDKWIDYLSSDDAPYPDALKYWTLRNVVNLGEYDKDKKVYPQRSKGTTKLFPDLNREALAYVLDAVDKKYKKQDIGLSALEQPDKEQFERLLQGENFGKLYAWAIEKVTPTSGERLKTTDGKWVKYDQGSDHIPLVASIQGHGTGWCTAGESTAATQLKGGDFYVYYSHDAQGQPTIPRAAIRMEGDSIAEVRGIAAEQNIDPYIGPVVEKKLEDFPDRKFYQKRVADMKRLTEIDKKVQAGSSLRVPDIDFLYELDGPIDGFGYNRDPRIEEIKSKVNLQEDMPNIFGCTKEQIIYDPAQITLNTKAYIGPLIPGIFDKLQHVEYIYTSFPDRKIRKQSLEIGGKTSEDLQESLEAANVKVAGFAQEMLKSPAFGTQPNSQMVETIQLSVGDLGIVGRPTTELVFEHAKRLGLELCPAEIGPQYRLQYMDHLDESLYIGMNQIAISEGNSLIFKLTSGEDGAWLSMYFAPPSAGWDREDKFIFRLPRKI